MNTIRTWIDRFITKVKPLTAGTYHYQSPPDQEQQYRLHLRLEEDGHGILIVNASTILHLNQTAAEYAYHLVQQTPENDIAKIISKRFNVSKEHAQHDFLDLRERLDFLVHTPDLDPVTYLYFDRAAPYSQSISAPYRLDCALTYLTSEGASDAAPGDRVKRELLTSEWLSIISKSWQVGIPHIVFTGGEPTLRSDLVELITAAEKNGQITGLITDGLRITEPDYLHDLLQAGLDHIMIVLNIDSERGWEAIRDSLPEDISLAVHLTLTLKNQSRFLVIIDRLMSMGVKTLSLSTSTPELKEVLEQARGYTSEHGMDLIWDLPVPYSTQNPVSLELLQDGESVQGAGKAWLYVEPDGDVLPGQGIIKIMGNLVTDSWDQIWSNR